MATKFFVDVAGNYIGGFDGALPPSDAIEVPDPPSHAAQKWNGAEWLARVLTQAEINEDAKDALVALDMGSIRALREYIAAQPDAPQILKDKDNAAKAERLKMK